MTSKILHFTFGPVQSFVAQARRTRDLWAGSYLLSYLAGCAMKAVPDARDNVIMPAVRDDPLFLALCSPSNRPKSNDHQAAQVGSLPSRFKATVPADFDGKKCADAVCNRWRQIADKVYMTAAGLEVAISREIWDRQINRFWDCVWVYGNDDALLDVRKNLRTHYPEPEEGEKCSVCGERQEVSGLGMGTGTSRAEMGRWWSSVRDELRKDKIRKATLFDLREGERLCAVCLVKRAFPFPDIANDEEAIGWPVPVNYPSTAYMSAVDWIIRVFETCRLDKTGAVRKAVERFIDAAKKADIWLSETATATRIQDVEKFGKESGLNDEVEYRGKRERWKFFADLDGGAFFDSVIQNEKEFEVDEGKSPDSGNPNKNRNALRTALDGIHRALADWQRREKAAESHGGVKATPFYAHLLMDGDNMGRLLSDNPTRQADISLALAAFTQAVREIVRDHNGKLIYAGGDDVFALLPVDQALACAAACRDAYRQAFELKLGADTAKPFTISAAIEYAHMQTALGVVVRDAHKLLDEVAKDRCGRDGLACRVWKRGGPVLTWAQPWERVLAAESLPESKRKPATIVDEAKALFQDESDDAGHFSSKFFYKLRELLEKVTDEKGALSFGLKEDTAQGVLVAEYLANRDVGWPRDWTEKKKREAGLHRVKRLLALIQEHKRDKGQLEATGRYRADGALFVRFLSQKEV